MTYTSKYTASGNANIEGNTGSNSASTWNNDVGINVNQIYTFVSGATDVVNAKLSALKTAGSSISITDMFEMQMKMNRLSQFSEMATAVVSAAGASIQSIARNVK